MAKPPSKTPESAAPTAAANGQSTANVSQPAAAEETPLEALASVCSVLVIGLFVLTFLAQNFVIPSGSMEKTLLVGDHLFVDRITIAHKLDAAGALPGAEARGHCGVSEAG